MSRSIIPGGLWVLGVAVLTAAGCDRGPRAAGQKAPDLAAGRLPPAAAQPVRIAAASDLQRVLPRLIERFQSQAPTAVTPALTLDASGQLAQQIKAGAPFDLFLSANVKFVSDLAAAGLVEPASVRPYARGSLVLCLHRAAGDQVRGLAGEKRWVRVWRVRKGDSHQIWTNAKKSSSLVKSTLRPTPRLSTWKTILPGECRLGRDIHGFLSRYPSSVRLVAVTFSPRRRCGPAPVGPRSRCARGSSGLAGPWRTPH
jgi:Bacterial extracellular solute-binding protein